MDGENAHSEIKLNWMGILAKGEREIRWDGCSAQRAQSNN